MGHITGYNTKRLLELLPQKIAEREAASVDEEKNSTSEDISAIQKKIGYPDLNQLLRTVKRKSQ